MAVKYQTGLEEAIAAAKKQISQPLFIAPRRRSIPMRYRALGELLSGENNPGLPTGCILEIVGQAHAGKTSLTFALIDAVINQPRGEKIHAVQTKKGIEWIEPPNKVLFLDFEHAIDLTYLHGAARNVEILATDDNGNPLNLDTANVFVHQPLTLEEGCDLALHMVASQEFGLVVMDSIAAMLSKEEAEKSMSENTVGKQARSIGMMLRKSAGMLNKYGVVLVLINQWRDKIGMAFGDPRTTPGGKAPAFYDAIRLDVMGPQKTPWFSDGKTVKIKCFKNKVTGRKGEVIYHLQTGHGLSAEVELTDMATAAGLITNTSHKRPVKLKTRGGNVKSYPNMSEWIESLRRNPKLFDAVLKGCERKGIKSSRSIESQGGWDDED